MRDLVRYDRVEIRETVFRGNAPNKFLNVALGEIHRGFDLDVDGLASVEDRHRSCHECRNEKHDGNGEHGLDPYRTAEPSDA